MDGVHLCVSTFVGGVLDVELIPFFACLEKIFLPSEV